MNYEGVKLLTEHFSPRQLAIPIVMAIAFADGLRDWVLGMLGVHPTAVESILAGGVAGGVIGLATGFVMLRLTPKGQVEQPKKPDPTT